MNRLAIIASVVVVVTVAAGIIVAGGPGVARQRRLDDRRTQDLQFIEGAVDGYSHKHNTLPPSLDTVRAEQQIDIPVDPETRAPYRYEVTGPTGYRLCATFAQPSNDAFGPTSWAHGIGSVCFGRTALTRGRNGD